MAMMEEETCRKRQWVPVDRFVEIYTLCKILPGPVATQMAIYLGLIRGGTLGGLLAGVLFILPSFFIVLGLSWVYVSTGFIQKASGVLFGMQAAALAVIMVSTLQLSRPYKSIPRAWVVGAIALLITLVQPSIEPLVILASGLIGVATVKGWFRRQPAREAGTLVALFLTCLKSGALVFGTGLAVVPMLAHDVVTRYQWLTQTEFMDGLAIGQITPGPVVITSTFIGFKVAGLAGAVAATSGIFMPAFFNVLVLVPRFWGKVSGTPGAQAFANWAIPAVIGGIWGTTARLGIGTVDSWSGVTCFVAALSFGLVLKIPSWLIIPGVGLLWGLVTAF